MATDIHRHLVPPALYAEILRRPAYALEEVARQGDSIDVLIRGLPYRLNDRFFDAALQAGDMDALGIDEAILSLATPFLGPHVPADAASAAATLCNDAYADMVGAAGRWRAWAFLPLHDPAFAARELQRRMAQPGFVGGHIATSHQGAYLPDARYTPLVEAAVALDVPLFLHPADPPGRDRTGDYELSVVAGYLFESTVGILRMVCSGFLDRWPTLKLVVPHAGGFAPLLRARMQREVDTNPELARTLAAPVGDYLRRFWFDSICFEPAWLQAVTQILPLDQLLLGSDAPFPLGEPDPVGFLRRSLPAEALPGVFGGNLARLLAR
jgi:aminocarboxymuconate-semialdehyde decarboxylase